MNLTPFCEIDPTHVGRCEYDTRGCTKYHSNELDLTDFDLDDQFIDETIEILLGHAWNIGVQVNTGKLAAGKPLAPRAFQATTPYHACAIMELQREKIRRLERRLNEFESGMHDDC